MGISSTAIVTKLIVETGRLGNRETRTILGIAVIEDIFMAFYLALSPARARRRPTDPAEAITGIATAFAFLLGLGAIAR